MIIADVNLVAYLLIAGEFTPAAVKVLERDEDWFAPLLWRTELLNVLATSVRAGHLKLDEARNIQIHAPAYVRDVEVPELDVLELSVQSKFGTYDCFYIIAAQRLGTRVVTADRAMLRSFPDNTVSITDFGNGK